MSNCYSSEERGGGGGGGVGGEERKPCDNINEGPCELLYT